MYFVIFGLFASEIWGKMSYYRIHTVISTCTCILGLALWFIHVFCLSEVPLYYVLKQRTKKPNREWGVLFLLYLISISNHIVLDIIIKNQEIIFLTNTIIFFEHCTIHAIGDGVPVSKVFLSFPLAYKINYVLHHFMSFLCIQQCSQTYPKMNIVYSIV